MSRSGPEAIYRLSPAQEGMLFHSLSGVSFEGAYLLQVSCELAGTLDARALRSAWERLAARHTVLRTSFHWEELEHPLQVVHREVELPWIEEDWRGASPAEQRARLEAWRERDRGEGFDPETPPLMRLALVRLAEERWWFLWTHHHLILDGWSQPVLMREVFAFYGEAAGGPAAQVGAARPFGEHIGWLRGKDKKDLKEKNLKDCKDCKDADFWREALKGFGEATALPGEGGGESGVAGEVWLRLEPVVTRALLGMARAHRLTASTVVHGAWALLLARHAGAAEVLFGTVVSGRPPHLALEEAAVGMFINTLPVRLPVPGEERLIEWLGEVQRRLLEIQARSHTALVDAQGWSEVPRGQALFETLVAFESYPADGVALGVPGLEIREVRSRESAAYPLVLAAAPGDSLALHLIHDPGRVSALGARRLLGHLESLLHGMAEAPESRLADLPLLSEGERHQALHEWNDTATAEEAALHHLFEAQAATTPEAVALSWRGQRLTYAELDRRAESIAALLQSLGPEAIVAVAADRSPDMIAACLGIWKSGATYLPLDLTHPPERLGFLLRDSAAAVLLVPSSLQSLQSLMSFPEAVRLVRLEPTLAVTPPRHHPKPPAEAAYALYTSGSTGLPKAVLVPHRGLSTLARFQREALEVHPGDRVLQFASPGFDASIWEMAMALASGAELCLADRDELLPGPGLARLLRERRVTHLTIPPSALAVLSPAENLPDLRVVCVAGEACPPDVARAWAERCRLVNGYGPTEATVCATLERVEGPGRPPIGRPLPGCRAHVVDTRQSLAPVGVAGELWLAGAGLARGYLGRPDLTAERFVPNSFSEIPGDRLYRTGDLARHLPDGRLEFLGRADSQLKIRGFRVEPEEIEAALREHLEVREAAVVPVGESRLVACVVPAAEGRALPAAALRAFLAERLPEFMIPSAFVAFDSLPATPNGKLDRQALARRSAAGGASAERGFVAPRTPVEAVLAGIWAEVLGLGERAVGIHDDFFELGGHSLLAGRLASRVREALGAELPIRAPFEARSLVALAQRVEEALRSPLRQGPPLAPVPRSGILPLSFAQQRLWFLARMSPEDTAYHVPVAARLEGRLSVLSLRRALEQVVNRHEALRTSFPEQDGEPVQAIHPPGSIPLPLIDLSAGGDVEALLRDEASRPFDLAAGPLVRALLVRRAPEEHLLLVTTHHIVTDGWSTGLLVGELGSFYADAESEAPALPIQYADFAAWQRSWLAAEVLDEQLGFWRRTLDGVPASLDLPLDRPRPPVWSSAGGRRELRLPAGLVRDLRALARREGATPFMALLAAFAALLGRHSGQDDGQEDLVVGTPVAGRRRTELEGLIGLFVNTLPLRIRLGEEGFRGQIERVRETTLAAYAHQDLPFERLVEELRPERDLSRSPLFQVLLSYGGNPLDALAPVKLPGLTLTPLETETGAAKFDLTLEVAERADGLAAGLEYAADLFDASTIELLASRFVRLLAGALADPARPLADIPLWDDAERRQVLTEWGDGGPVATFEGCLHQLFAARAEAAPDATAVVADTGERVSYRELNARADAVARRIWRAGAGLEDRVAVFARRTPDLVAALLGVLKAGAAYVPLDPNHPAERLALLLEDTGCRLLLADSALAGRLPPAPVPRLFLEDIGNEEGAVEVQVLPDHLAYVIPTSGSTGRPKGVAIRHGAVSALLGWAAGELGPEDLAGVFAGTSIAFDLSVFELFLPLSRGGTVILGEDALALDGHPAAAEVTLVNGVPSAVAELLRAGALPPTVRAVCLAGEPLPGALAAEVHHLGPRLYNLYGPSETTTYSTFARVVPGEAEPPIGRPVAGTRVRVLDPGLRPVPAGVPGEICLAGEGLARGYIGRPELTAERFVPDPLAPGERLYRTGDLGRWRADGELEFLGRRDLQIKLRGYRIELGEIEAALAAHPAVREAAVIAVGAVDAPAGKRLLACVVLGEGSWGVGSGTWISAVPTQGPPGRPGESCGITWVSGEGSKPAGPELSALLRDFLRSRLPEPMMPALFVALREMPRLPSGKLDRAALSRLNTIADESAAREEAAPEDAIQELLAGIWCEVLGIERVGRGDDFFELGGHSLLATRVVSRVRDLFGVDLPLRGLFEARTVSALAERVARSLGEETASAPPLVPVPRDGELPLSFAQQRLWFLDQLRPGDAAYNLPYAIVLAGPLDLAALARSLAEIVRRHESLRTTFRVSAGRPVQVVSNGKGSPPPIVDLSALPRPRRYREGKRLGEEEAVTPFDLVRGPLLRSRVVRVDESEHVLLVSLHHIVADGWSIGVLMREMGALYRGFTSGVPVALPPLPAQYADFAVWQRRWLAGEVLDHQLAYWKKTLAGVPVTLDLPTDRPRPPVRRGRGTCRAVSLDGTLAGALRTLGRSEGATLFMALLAAWGWVLARGAGQRQVVIGSPIANRRRSELEGVIGFFVNTLAMRLDLSSGTFRELLGRSREVTLGGYAHQDLPFERLVDELELPRDLSRTPLFQAALVLHNLPSAPPDLPGLVLRPMDCASGTSKFDLLLDLTENPQGIAGWIEVDTDLFDPPTADRLSVHLRNLIAAAAAEPDRPLAELSLWSAAERQQVLIEWNTAPLEESRPEPLLHARFEAWAARTPWAVAVVSEGERLTYGELDARAARLARRLRALGVGPETRVGLAAERSPGLIVGMIGILKAGGAYVPLDPAYPRNRLDLLLGDSRATVLVTERHLLGKLPHYGGRLVFLDGEMETETSRSSDPPTVLAENPAYVIYTSGSTGRPKGVPVSHASVTRLLDAAREPFQISERDVWTLFHSFAFDFSVWEIWGALAHGGRLVVVPHWVARSPDLFWDVLLDERVTVLSQTPSAFRQLANAAEEAGWSTVTGREPALRLVVFGGEALDVASLRPWFGRFGDRRPRLVNMYGITEITVHATLRPLSRADAVRGASVLGLPLPHLRICVVDESLRPVPAGVAGELCVGGEGLSRGYLGRADLTAARFVPDPFAESFGRSGERLYRSGDLARWLPQGDLEYLGRIDHQIKVRGFRVEPGEIEAILSQHPAVQQAAVVAREAREGGKRLIAYVVRRKEGGPWTTPGVGRPRWESLLAERSAGANPSPAEALSPHDLAAQLRAYLRSILPDPWVPALFLFLDEMPLTPHGKVDRPALVGMPVPGSGAIQETFVAPRTPVEEALASVWAGVLALDRVGIDDNFFALGGDSILSIQARARAAQRGLAFSLQQLFEHQTVRDLARALTGSDADLRGGGELSSPFSLVSEEDLRRLPEGLEDAYPLSSLQAGLVFHSGFEGTYQVYLNTFHLRHAGTALDLDRLRAAIGRLIARHPMLRTSFDFGGAEPLQLVWPSAEVPLTVEDWTGLSRTEQDENLAAWIETELRRPFDWTRAPLVRFHVHRRSADTFQFTLAEPFLDGWSVATCLTELFVEYTSPSTELPGTSPRSSYREFVALERAALASPENQGFWQREMEGFTAARLPRLDVSPGRGGVGTRPVRLSPEVCAGLMRLAATEALPLKSVLLAAHAKAMGAATGRADVMTGLLANGRPEEDDGEKVLGIFLNTVPFRFRLRDAPGGTTWSDLARRAFAAERGMLPFRRYPLAELQRRHGGEPLFDTVFNFTHFHVARRLAALDGMKVVSSFSSEQTYFTLTAQFDLDIESTRIELALIHAEPGLRGEEVERLAGIYQRVLEAMAGAAERNGDCPHDAWSPLSEAERHQILTEWNDTILPSGFVGSTLSARPAPCLHHLFAEQVERTPEAVALVCGSERVTYAALAERARRVSRRLRAAGAGPEVLVGVCAEREPDLIAALLGVLGAGAAWLPLDPAWPRERLALLLEDARAGLLLVGEGLADTLPETAARILPLIAEDDPEILLHSAVPDNLAYVLYTSGSTGRPKGVAVRHRSVVALLEWAAMEFSPKERAGVLASTSICFDLSVFEIFLPLVTGGTAILVRDALALPEAPDGVTLVNTVPSALAELVRAGALPDGLRAVNLAGEPLSRSLAEEIHRSGPELLLRNLYGPTEDTTYTTLARVRPGAGGPPSIGRPITGSRIYLVDTHRQAVPAGSPGELCIAGEGLARGYLHRPHRTAEAFVPDPFSACPGERMYRTGDLARHRPDGALEFLGRLDQQVKVRGYRIEPAEIEAALETHPEVRRALVLAREQRLVAYVAGEGKPDAAALRAYLAGRLPAALVPSAFVFLEALPLTPSGKVDRASLPPPEALAERAGFVAPRTPIETVLAGIWERVLRVERIGVHDDFFELGGHSLLAIQVASRVRDELRVEIAVRELFSDRTIAALAARLGSALRTEGLPAPMLPLGVLPGAGGEAPLSFAQQRLWFLDRLEPGRPVYNVPAAMLLEGELDIPALAAALRELARRHAALRTRFRMRNGEPAQWVDLHASLPLSTVDASGVFRGHGEAGRLVAEEAARPFDLERGPLARALLIRLPGPPAYLFLLTLHHVVADGWSMGILFRELGLLYGRSSPLPELPVQYRDYARWQRKWLTEEALAPQLAWWREWLGGDLEPLALPTDRPRPARQTFRGGRRYTELAPALAESLRTIGRRQGATLFMTLLAAFQAFLSRISGQTAVRVGTPVANRGRTELEGLVGFFVNTLVLPARLEGAPAFAELVSRTRETALAAFARADLPFEQLVDALRPERDLSRSPLFQAMLTLQSLAPPEPELRGLSVRLLEVDAGVSRFDLTLSLGPAAGGGLAGALEYASDLFDLSTAERLLAQLSVLLRGAAAEPGCRLSDLPLLSESERHQVGVEWNEGAAGFPPPEGRVHEWIAAVAARSPELPAVISSRRVLTYGELDRRSRRLAARLRRRCREPETLVGICAESSPERVVAVLAVLWAGGAWVPLDPDHPADRLRFLLEDSGARVLLTRERFLSLLGETRAEVILLEDEETEMGALPVLEPPASDHLAYVIYTSGSTGRPKGVEVTYGNLAWSTAARLRFYPEPVAAFALVPSFSFDSSVAVLFWTLCRGGALVLPDGAAHEDLPGLVERMAEAGVSHWLSVPSLWALALERAGGRLGGLRTVVVAGEPCPRRLVERHAELLPEVALFNEYGPTEATVWSTVHRTAMADTGAVAPIGWPVPGARILLLDAGLRMVPAGVPGELCVSGPGVARGYRRRPALTAERFGPDPWSGAPGARLYRTGDRARRRPDGTLEFLGRLDEQVKIRGFRVEPGEVEAVLASLPEVREAAVVAVPDAEGGARLRACVVPERETVDALVLRAELAERLPAPMVPSSFILLEALPRTPNGKVDRRVLAGMDSGWHTDRVPVAPVRRTEPRDRLELRLCRIWEEVLGEGPVGVDDDFFARGGHSLLAVRLLAQIERETGVDLPLATLFRTPTVAGLAEELRSELRREKVRVISPLVPFRVDGGSETPMFFIHPVGGTVLCYRELARCLEGIPFYALEAPGVEEGEPVDSVERLADLYLQEVRTVQPQGPYLLGGWSFGGLVALEMGRRLEAAGEEAALVALVDTRGPGVADGEGEPDEGLLLAALDHEVGGLAVDDLARARRLLAVARAHLAARDRYRPASLPAGTVLFRASGALLRTGGGAAAGWEDFSGLRLEDLPGDHYSLLEVPAVRELADRLRSLSDGMAHPRREAG